MFFKTFFFFFCHFVFSTHRLSLGGLYTYPRQIDRAKQPCLNRDRDCVRCRFGVVTSSPPIFPPQISMARPSVEHAEDRRGHLTHLSPLPSPPPSRC
ncbi:MAG: hypothetical protein FE78DRAFT_383630 [Acidomyces sp. 'richmondensis']|nr:MAG: hypothetical protein FE78DRAFT_383630 [Acidomyces sp. 'richmondensis']